MGGYRGCHGLPAASRFPRQRPGFLRPDRVAGRGWRHRNPSWSARPVDRGVGDISQTPSAESLAGAGMAYRWRMTHRYGCHNRHAGVPPRQDPPDQTPYNAAPAHCPVRRPFPKTTRKMPRNPADRRPVPRRRQPDANVDAGGPWRWSVGAVSVFRSLPQAVDAAARGCADPGTTQTTTQNSQKTTRIHQETTQISQKTTRDRILDYLQGGA